ncbi:MAG: hypothetical protein ABJC07_07735 [Acidobacteriota bacterium]
MSLAVRSRAAGSVRDRVAPRSVPRGGALLSPESASDLDREIERRVFLKAPGRAVPPFSTEDWTAAALAQQVSRQTGWACEVSEHDGTWSAIWFETPRPSSDLAPQKILSRITASAPTRALAICRALIKATRCPAWPRVFGDAPGEELVAGGSLGASRT